MTYFGTLKKYWYIVAGIVVITCILVFVISIAQTPKYRSTVKILVIQKQVAGMDAYTATKASESIANTLTRVMYSSTFMQDVLESGFEIKDDFSTDPEKRAKEWKKTVETEAFTNTGIIQISTYDPEANQAEQFAYGVAYVLTSKGQQYHGGGAQVEIKMIDSPVTTEKPAKPNIILNMLAGFGLSLLVSLGIIYLLTEEKEIALPKPSPKLAEAVKPLIRRPTPPERPREFKPKEIPRPKEKKKEIRELPKPPTVGPKESEEAYTPEKVDKWIKTGKFE